MWILYIPINIYYIVYLQYLLKKPWHNFCSNINLIQSFLELTGSLNSSWKQKLLSKGRKKITFLFFFQLSGKREKWKAVSAKLFISIYIRDNRLVREMVGNESKSLLTQNTTLGVLNEERCMYLFVVTSIVSKAKVHGVCTAFLRERWGCCVKVKTQHIMPPLRPICYSVFILQYNNSVV